MDAGLAIFILLFLFAKHFVADFLYQPPWQWQNKGTLGHPGGVFHAVQHGVLTALLFLFIPAVPFNLMMNIIMIEIVLHYFIDYAKMNINRIKGWKADTSPHFWTLMGFDQFLHALTYILIFGLLI